MCSQDQTGDHVQGGQEPASYTGARAAEEDCAPSNAVGSSSSEIVLVTGMSGAGRTEALHALEDLGYFCIDNLPPSMIMPLTSLVNLSGAASMRIAVACDIRSRSFFGQLKDELDKLSEQHVSYRILFLDADDESLLARYSAKRRRHPLIQGTMTVGQAIKDERRQLSRVREMAHVVLDTSHMLPARLRERINAGFSTLTPQQTMNTSVFSFGYKHGLPYDADLIIDVRFLPNPFYDPSMRDLTGFDPCVRDFVMNAPTTREFFEAWKALLDVLMPGYVREGKQHLTIAIGCTGGQHRSVAVAEATGAYLLGRGYPVTTTHRDINRFRNAEGTL